MNIQITVFFQRILFSVTSSIGIGKSLFLHSLTICTLKVKYLTVGKDQYMFIETLDAKTGCVEYVKPEKGTVLLCVKCSDTIYVFTGATFATWSGCYTSQHDKMALLACPAINGFYSLVAYSWERYGRSSREGYCTSLLLYRRNLLMSHKGINYTQGFQVSTKYQCSYEVLHYCSISAWNCMRYRWE